MTEDNSRIHVKKITLDFTTWQVIIEGMTKFGSPIIVRADTAEVVSNVTSQLLQSIKNKVVRYTENRIYGKESGND